MGCDIQFVPNAFLSHTERNATGEWVLIDLANSDQLGGKQRVKEKMLKMSQVLHSLPLTSPTALPNEEGSVVGELKVSSDKNIFNLFSP